MLIQVSTTHGKKFRRAGITFGPIPVRLWCGATAAPGPNLRVISATALERLEQATGELGPLHIERDVAFAAGPPDERQAELDALRARVAELDAERKRAGVEVEALQTQVAELDRLLAAARAQTEDVAGLRERVTELEQALADEQKRAAELAQKLERASEGRSRRSRR